MTKRRVMPELWAGWMPFGLGQTKPQHFSEIARTIWENRRHPVYAWNILNKGVCDGCALGTTGMRDWTIDTIHLCTVRLNLLKLNTMEALPWERLRDDLPRLGRGRWRARLQRGGHDLMSGGPRQRGGRLCRLSARLAR